MPAVLVRSAAPADFDRVTALLEELGRTPVTDATYEDCRALYEAHVADPEADHLVAEADGTIVGFCSLHYRERLNNVTRQAWIPDLVVDPAARGRGAGRALLEEAERRASARGCHDLTLESGDERTDAHRLYRAFGMDSLGLFFRKAL